MPGILRCIILLLVVVYSDGVLDIKENINFLARNMQIKHGLSCGLYTSLLGLIFTDDGTGAGGDW